MSPEDSDAADAAPILVSILLTRMPSAILLSQTRPLRPSGGLSPGRDGRPAEAGWRIRSC
jgi:hypothetical protein